MLSNINGGNNESVTSGPLQQFKRRKVQTIRYLSSCNYLQINLMRQEKACIPFLVKEKGHSRSNVIFKNANKRITLS